MLNIRFGVVESELNRVTAPAPQHCLVFVFYFLNKQKIKIQVCTQAVIFLSCEKIFFPADSLNFTVVSDIGLTDIGLSSVGIRLIQYRIKIPSV
jgi:hypothetical protein